MVTCVVLKVLKLLSLTARVILRTFKTSFVLINPEIHLQSYDFLYVLYSIKLVCPTYSYNRFWLI